MKGYGRPEAVVTEKLQAGAPPNRKCGLSGDGRSLNNRAENSHHPLRRREKTRARLRPLRSPQKFAATHSSIHYHFNLERRLYSRSDFKENRAAALAEWRQTVV
jgi:putative transposase